MNVVAVIPARKGSRGIPGKNTMDWFGKPLVQWTIEQAIAAGDLQVIVTTDDPEVMAVADRLRVDGVWRPEELSRDESSVETAMIHAIDCRAPTDWDSVMLLNPTSPFRQPETIPAALEKFRDEPVDSIASACLITGFVWTIGRRGLTMCHYDPQRRPRRQDRTQQNIEENGSLYLCRRDVFMRDRCVPAGDQFAFLPMHPLDSFQLDEPDDIELMKSLWPQRMQHGDRSRKLAVPRPCAV